MPRANRHDIPGYIWHIPVKSPSYLTGCEYILEAMDMLKRRSLLSDGKHLCFGWGHGVIFPLLSKKDLETPSFFGPSLSTAYTLIRDLDISGIAVCEAGGEYVVPEKALRDGPMPEVKRFNSLDEERRYALEWIRTRLEKGVSPDDMLVLGFSRSEMAKLEEWLQDAGIPAQLLGGRVRAGVVRLSTVHSAKGLDGESVLNKSKN